MRPGSEALNPENSIRTAQPAVCSGRAFPDLLLIGMSPSIPTPTTPGTIGLIRDG